MTWRIYQGTGTPHDGINQLPAPPPWRRFTDGSNGVTHPVAPTPEGHVHRAKAYRGDSTAEIDAVNAALLLRRPLLVTGQPGTGKSSLAYAVAHELQLGQVLHWPIVSRTRMAEGLYQYDAIGRMQDVALAEREGGSTPDIGHYMRLGPLGTALLPYEKPRALLIDELDKGDIDLPNDLLTLFEEGEFEIPELTRVSQSRALVELTCADGTTQTVHRGRVQCRAFPFIVLTSNGERDFPPAFLRRCIRLELEPPSAERLARIIEAHLGALAAESVPLIEKFLEERERGDLATDQLLNAVFLLGHHRDGEGDPDARGRLRDLLLRSLSSP